MKIVLDREDAHFSTLLGPFAKYRAMLVKVNGKPFVTTRTVESFREEFDKDYTEHIDRFLVESMERMLTKVFEDSCAAVPEGVDLMGSETESHTLNVIQDFYRGSK